MASCSPGSGRCSGPVSTGFGNGRIRNPIPSPYREVITKELLQELVRECRNVFKEYKGLEIVHVEAQDGTFVSIRL